MARIASAMLCTGVALAGAAVTLTQAIGATAPAKTPAAAHPATAADAPHAAAAPARSATDAAAASGDVRVFARYAGTWNMELHRVETPYSKPSNETMLLKNDCWHSEIFYVCDQIIDGTPKALIVFFYNADEKTFGSFPITAGSDTLHPGQVIVEGKTVTFPWQINDNGKGVYMRIVNTFTTPDTIEVRQEYSEDGAKWLPMATGVEHRVAKGAAKSK